MLLNKLMEGETITTKNLISSIKSFNTDEKEHGAIKALIKNFILPEKENMAIKDQMDNNNKYVYTIPVKPPTERAKTLFEAKQAFLNSTIASNIPLRTEPLRRREVSNQELTLHYAQIAITTEAEDTRSTGGGQEEIRKDIPKPLNVISSPMTKRRCEGNPRKVSFKTKTASVSHRRPPIATKTMTISNSKVSELTRKFNNLGTESHNGSVLQSQIAKTIEELQSLARFPASDSSPSSTLSSSPNIKVVVRHRRSSKRRHNKKRCSSMDSIDKQISTDSKSPKIRVIRSKSDGTKSSKCKSPKKCLDYPDSSEFKSSFDCVDGLNSSNDKEPEVKVESGNAVKNVIKKFECEITAQIQSTNTLKRQSDSPKSTTPIREKPKVPERKQSLVVTKNLVVKDGVPKIRTIKTVLPTDQKPNNSDTPNIVKRRESIYDRNKFKTNYIHTDKLPMKIVEIIQEDVNENNEILTENVESTPKVSDKVYQDVTPNITPNDSFLWRWKSSTQIYSDTEKSDCSYGVLFNDSTDSPSETKDISLTEEYTTNITVSDDVNDFQNNTNSINNSDFESSLVEAFNKDVLRGFTSKPKANPIENDYELLEPRDIENLVVIPIKTVEKPSRINCPLPEIPKECPKDIPPKSDKENIYQCLLEMRSHPEGDESSMHNYELCADDLEERTRGDGDSDDGYEYCKSPIKPYCLTSSSGIEIAENYKPYEGKNYGISKSVSGTSTVSYEKIGSERIYEKIPAHVLKSKESSPSQSSIHSMMSSDYNDTENIYDTIKHGDEASLSHCYESIPNSPSMVKMRNNLKKQLASAVQKRLSYDAMSNISQSTMSSEQKTNSIYGQRSMISYNGQEIAFQVPCSENSVSDRSDRSDRSDDWVDVSDDEKSKEQKIIILRERGRSRKSTISWSQKVRHQRHHTPKKKDGKDGDSSDSGHLYESLEPPPSPRAPPLPLDDDFDSFDSDTDTDDHDKISSSPPPLPASRLPSPPSGGPYTLTKIANAAQKKMRQLTRNLTKKYNTVAMDVKPFKSPQNQTNGTYDVAKTKKSPIYANYEKPESPVYTNVNFTDARNVFNKTAEEEKKKNGFREELKSVISEKRLSNGEAPPLLPEREKVDKPTTPTSENSKKDSGTLSRKTYFSFKSRFRRASSIAVDINTDVPSALKITNSTFYLTDSMDGDSGFSNCSDGPASSSETLTAPARRSAGPRAELRARRWADSSPCLALERPGVPPPPPPPPSNDSSAVHEELKRLLPTLSRKDKGPRTRTSWYAECGASDTASVRTSNTSWYAESGLYQVGNISTSSGASSGSHPASPLPHSLFTHEPLYQFYNAAKVESVCREGDSDSDAYDASPSASEPSAPPPRPSAMALVSPRGPARTLWCEVPEVVNSAVLSSLAPAQKRLQEAKFELLTSEASYLNSLNVLETNFASHPAFRDPSVLSRDDWETLFSDILPVRKCSALLMSELEKCWQESVLLQGICEAVRAHAERHFHVYVAYCERQAVMVRALQRLKEKPAFTAALKKLESHPACQALSLHSFLMLPMQRVTRLPLLLDAVLRALRPADPEYQPCLHALATLNCFVSQCNEGARNTERLEEMWRLTTRIAFPSGLRDPPALGPACGRRDRKAVRWLVRSGEMTQLVWKTDELKLTFGKKFHKVPLHLFLFNDLLVITKKKGEEQYVAVDYCARSLLEVCSRSEHAAARHALLLTLLDNHDHRTVEMLMSCASETDAQRWASALQPASSEGAECVYAGWDCPQVAAVFAHVPGQPDELALVEGDVLNVTRKTREGWFYGERTRDGEAGWFPGSYTVEIASAHVRARNLRQRYRLLALSATYLGQKKKVT